MISTGYNSAQDWTAGRLRHFERQINSPWQAVYGVCVVKQNSIQSRGSGSDRQYEQSMKYVYMGPLSSALHSLRLRLSGSYRAPFSRRLARGSSLASKYWSHPGTASAPGASSP